VFALIILAAAIATFLLSWTTTYPAMLVTALAIGIAGGSFAAGVSYLSRWYPVEQQGAVLGIFSIGHAGAAITLVVAPYLVLSDGWQAVVQVWAAALAVTAVVFWFAAGEDPVTRERRAVGERAKGLWEQLEPLRHLQVWRFSLYYFFVFGAFVGLSLWLPRYLIGVYGLDLAAAGLVAAVFAITAAVIRPYGNRLAEKY